MVLEPVRQASAEPVFVALAIAPVYVADLCEVVACNGFVHAHSPVQVAEERSQFHVDEQIIDAHLLLAEGLFQRRKAVEFFE